MRPDENKKRHIVVCGKGSGGGAEQVQADWNQSDDTQPDYIKNKPTVLAQWFGTQAEYDLIDPKDPNTIYNIEGSDNVQADWNESDNTQPDYIKNKPTIPAAQVNADWNESDSSSKAYIANKPTIPAAPVQSDWNESNSSSLAYIQNKPTIPSVPPMATETLTFTLQGGTVRTIEFYTVPNYFYIENLSDSNGTVSINPNSNNSYVPTFEVFYSTDRANWTSMGTTHWGGISTTIPANSKLYLKSTTDKWGTFRNNDYYNSITCNVEYKVGGNIMSLLYGDNFEGATFNTTNNTFAFSNLFKNNSNLISAENLLLPATTLAQNCYVNMFNGCTSLTTAPALPATTLADGCYRSMFKNCKYLTTPPSTLSATTLVSNCYYEMFINCQRLTATPVISFTTTAKSCCNSMFKGCNVLVNISVTLPDNVSTSCYQDMFNECKAMTTAPALPATDLTGANSCYYNMFNRCFALTTAPVLPATTLASNCYTYMFRGCTSLTAAPSLPATTLVYGCYEKMFDGCTILNNVTTYAQDISANLCVNSWLSGVSGTGDFYNLGGATFPSGASGIPTGWTEHTSL